MIKSIEECLLRQRVPYSVYASYLGGDSLQDILSNFCELLQEVVDEVNKYTAIVDALKEWIETQGLQDAVNKKLNDMVNDGTLEGLINQKIFGDLNSMVNDINLKQQGIYTFVTDFIEKGETPYNNAFQKAIDNTISGGVVYFPFKSNGYMFDDPTGNECVIINKPLTIKASDGAKIILSKNYSVDKDFIVVKPNDDKIGYNFDNIVVTMEQSVKCCRDVIVYDLSRVGARVSNSYMINCKIYPSNGFSLKVNNPVNTDGFFLNRISDNLFYSGFKGIRIGDSNDFIHNTFAGFNGFDVSLVYGSNTLCFEHNNFTARGGIIFHSGHNIKCNNNNIESGYSDSSYVNNALVNFLGDEVTDSWGLLGCSFIGNNITYRTTAPSIIKGIYVDKCRGLTINDNYLSNRGGGAMVETTLKASDTFIGRNSYSSANNEIIITDNGVNTFYTAQVYVNEQGHRKTNYVNGDDINRDAINDNSINTYRNKYSKIKNDAIKNVVKWDALNTFKPKEVRYSQKIGDNAKQISYIGDGYETFENEGFRIKDSNGFEWSITVSTTGQLTATRIN